LTPQQIRFDLDVPSYDDYERDEHYKISSMLEVDDVVSQKLGIVMSMKP
jgi:hypothetical protein